MADNVEEGQTLMTLTLSVSHSLFEHLKQRASEEGLGLSEVIEEILEEDHDQFLEWIEQMNNSPMN